MTRRDARPAFRNLTIAPAGGVPMVYDGRRAVPLARPEPARKAA